MKRFVICVILAVTMLLPVSCAEAIVEYVETRGFAITEVDESPGWRACHLMEADDAQTLMFSDNENAYYIVSGPLIDLDFDESSLRELLVSLVDEFDWDVSFFWPDYDHENQIAVSYGIKKDLEKTKSNYNSKDEYISALRSWLDADESAKWDAFYEKIDSMEIPKIEPNAILDCMSFVTGTRALSTTPMSAPGSYAQFIIGPKFALAGPGGVDVECGQFWHPALGEWSLAERWGLYGQVVKYISEHKVEVISDALTLTKGVSEDAIAFKIAIYDELFTYISDYYPFTDQIEIIILDNEA